MCGRYVFFDENDIEELTKIIAEVQSNLNVAQYKLKEIFPTNSVPIIKSNGKDNNIEIMKWGFPKWDNKGVIINARSETANEKKTFSGPLKTKRCVIPTTGFYEWDKEKTKLHFTYEQSPIMYLAGIHNTFTTDGIEYNAFTIFTRDANEYIVNVHNRMPVILYREELDNYLNDLAFVDYVFKRNNVALDMRVAY